ncbi:hypothetical protein [Streptomyces toxytricini]|uniref:Uncharacterized protein n=1 Tax=Streptomyces toxytricini TaxID=67369 RepID=A0ABW8EGL7_STRT5
MNDPDPLALAAQAAGHRELADTDERAHHETGDGTGRAAAEPIRTLPETAGTCRKDVPLRASAVGRPVEDAALPVSTDGAPAAPAGPYGRPDAAPAEAAGSRHRVPTLTPAAPSASARDRRLRRVLRRPVAAVLLFCGVLHLPGDPAAVPAAGPAALLPLVAAVLGLGFGVLLAVRGGDAAWRAGAAAAVGVVALHVVGGVSGRDPLRGAVSAPLPWAGAAMVLCAAVAALLAGLALAAGAPRARAGARG